MSRSTPQRPRHRAQQHSISSQGVGISDYESDVTLYAETHEAPPPGQVLHRTNPELNLAVLRRYVPSIQAILSTAANAVVYIFSPDAQTWDKSGVEGTLFVCEQAPDTSSGGLARRRGCVFVLNRKGLDNAVIDLAAVSDCEVASELLIFKMDDTTTRSRRDDAETQGPPKVVGLWVHADEDHTQAHTASIIQGAWRSIQDAAASNSAQVDTPQQNPGEGVGRRLQLAELFGPARAGASGSG